MLYEDKYMHKFQEQYSQLVSKQHMFGVFGNSLYSSPDKTRSQVMLSPM